MKLERHVGGLSLARKTRYLTGRGWREEGKGWTLEAHRLAGQPMDPLPISRAVHHQLTDDLSRAMAASGWKVAGYSPRGYVKMEDTGDGSRCSLPAALRKQARREGVKVGEFTYSLFLAALLDAEAQGNRGAL